MEQTGFSNGLPIIRQKPGSNNALGKVKFIFPTVTIFTFMIRLQNLCSIGNKGLLAMGA
jgi:hypothetical protein